MGKLRDLDERFERASAASPRSRWVLPAVFAAIAIAAFVGGLHSGRGVLSALVGSLAVAGGPYLGLKYSQRQRRG